jgi:polyamine oxidase
LYFAGSGGLYDQDYVQKRLDRADNVEKSGKKLSGTLHPSGSNDMSILAMQRLFDQYVHKQLNSSPLCSE